MKQDNIRTAMMRCVRCGQCRSVCPVFLAKGVESDSARGRVTLIRALLEGDISISRELSEKVWQCLLCHTCSRECPSGVEVVKIVLEGRARIAELQGLPFTKRAVTKWILPNLGLWGKFLALGSYGQKLLGRRVADNHWIPLLSFPLMFFRVWPQLDGKSLFQMLSLEPLPSPRDRVVFYAGCLLTYAYPLVGKAVWEVLRYNGVEVLVPADQTCCGLPALASGEKTLFNRMKEANLEVLRKVKADAVVTACPSCGSTLKEYYGGDLDITVFDFSEFLAIRGFKEPTVKLETVVTYHDPCHLRKAQKIVLPPRKILGSIPGITFKEVREPERCCGFGGTFSFSYPLLSRHIGAVKAGLLAETGADTVVTACPGCMMQLADGLYRRGSTPRVKHLAEMLAASYGLLKG